ncbi:hypothetical protein L6452_39950 [Arctium lappa]|uniref:Uncharacterized protein n=1 Tax=Arctium lappa TaxID=4217 RepID=A0ACB8XUL1_ARCLA|nr:hypothetical protein L6452_39950 [Arctium lappa]
MASYGPHMHPAKYSTPLKPFCIVTPKPQPLKNHLQHNPSSTITPFIYNPIFSPPKFNPNPNTPRSSFHHPPIHSPENFSS